MTELEWKILGILLEQAQTREHLAYGYMAAWTLGEKIGGDAATIQASRLGHPTNEYETALQKLFILGLVEEMPDLGERFRLVVK